MKIKKKEDQNIEESTDSSLPSESFVRANNVVLSDNKMKFHPLAKPMNIPSKPSNEEDDRTSYNDAELLEFKEIIVRKLKSAKDELAILQDQIANPNENGVDDTVNTYKTLDDGSATNSKENLSQLAARQRKFIDNLEAALVRVENKSYGICKVTGKLIPKERLRAVPHTTLSMEAKLNQYK